MQMVIHIDKKSLQGDGSSRTAYGKVRFTKVSGDNFFTGVSEILMGQPEYDSVEVGADYVLSLEPAV